MAFGTAASAPDRELPSYGTLIVTHGRTFTEKSSQIVKDGEVHLPGHGHLGDVADSDGPRGLLSAA